MRNRPLATRRALLTGAGALVLASGCSGDPAPTARPTARSSTRPTQEATIFDLGFEETNRFR
ncbi:MAG TPA: hypothetical protein VD859_11405, partial [Nocardioides sp.]|nr:hypothetical protein [Nocardioides sp.]